MESTEIVGKGPSPRQKAPIPLEPLKGEPSPLQHLDGPWIHELPTKPSHFKALIVSLSVLGLSVLGLYLAWIGPTFIEFHLPLKGKTIPTQNLMPTQVLESGDEANIATAPPPTTQEASHPSTGVESAQHLRNLGYYRFISLVPYLLGALGAIFAFLGVLSLIRTRPAHHFLKVTLWGVYPVMLGFAYLSWLTLFELQRQNLPIGGQVLGQIDTLKVWWELTWPALAICLCSAWIHTMLKTRSVHSAFTQQPGRPMDGDYLLEDLRTHGRDPVARKSIYGSAFTHYFLLVLVPFLLTLRSCVKSAAPPEGAGKESVVVDFIPKPKKIKKEQIIVRKDSNIILVIPPPDDIDKMVDSLTEEVYEPTQHQTQAQTGPPGKPPGEGPPGWPNGLEGVRVKFHRLSHSGIHWDDGMGKTKADANFMREFKKVTGLKVSTTGISMPISQLGLYADDEFPPFVFLTGDGPIMGIGSRDIQVLREYCQKGGMLIADAGSASFDHSFRDLMRRVFPSQALRTIADDDRIYRIPFSFPNGAPSFWSHGGSKGMGIKHNSRWMVYYHPGDMNDAWKSSGYSKVSQDMRESAYHLGVNLIFYAYREWSEAVDRLKK